MTVVIDKPETIASVKAEAVAFMEEQQRLHLEQINRLHEEHRIAMQDLLDKYAEVCKDFKRFRRDHATATKAWQRSRTKLHEQRDWLVARVKLLQGDTPPPVMWTQILEDQKGE